MTEPPPVPPPSGSGTSQEELLRVAGVLHLVFALLGLFGLGLLALHHAFLSTVLTQPELWDSPDLDDMPFAPEELLVPFRWLYLFLALLLVTFLILNTLGGVVLLKRRARVFAMLVAGMNSLLMPFGTVLGVLTLLLLTRDGVRELFEEKAA